MHKGLYFHDSCAFISTVSDVILSQAFFAKHQNTFLCRGNVSYIILKWHQGNVLF